MEYIIILLLLLYLFFNTRQWKETLDWQASRTEFWYERCREAEAECDQLKRDRAAEIEADGEWWKETEGECPY